MIKTKKTFSYREEKDNEERIKFLEDVRDEVEVQQGVKHEPKNMEEVNKKLKHYKELKEKYGVTRLEGSERSLAEKEISKLEDRLRQKWGGRFPTHSEYWVKQKDGGMKFLRMSETIRKLNADGEYNALVQRWKTLQRSMEPSDPHASNTLKFFSH